jgi:hypothetical protein
MADMKADERERRNASTTDRHMSARRMDALARRAHRPSILRAASHHLLEYRLSLACMLFPARARGCIGLIDLICADVILARGIVFVASLVVAPLRVAARSEAGGQGEHHSHR